MKYFVPTRARVEKDVIVRIRRVLRGKGQLSVGVGQQVSPEEIIGTSLISSGFRTLNLSQLLLVPPQEVEKYLVRKLGQRIYQDELLAYKKGWTFGKATVVTAPTDGILDFFNNTTGELRMTFLPKKTVYPAGVWGIVEDVDSQRGQVIIRTQVSRVYGVFGSGRSRDGILHILGKKDDLVSKSEILTKYDEHILVGGSLFFKDAISNSISCGVNGLIAGGINAKDYRGMAGGRLIFPKKLDNDIGISIVVCEGFGSIPLGLDIFEILSQYEGKFVSVDGNKAQIFLPSSESSSIKKVRNTILPKLSNEDLILDEHPVSRVLDLKVGCKVRIVGNSYLGEQGKIIAINQSETLMPSGIKTHLATVEGARRKIQVPVANCEIIQYSQKLQSI